jgi:hypothetical protein
MLLNLETAAVLALAVDPDQQLKDVLIEMMSAASIYPDVDTKLFTAVTFARSAPKDDQAKRAEWLEKVVKPQVVKAMVLAVQLGWTKKKLGRVNLERLGAIESEVELLQQQAEKCEECLNVRWDSPCHGGKILGLEAERRKILYIG